MVKDYFNPAVLGQERSSGKGREDIIML